MEREDRLSARGQFIVLVGMGQQSVVRGGGGCRTWSVIKLNYLDER